MGKIEIGNGDPASTFYIDDRFIAGPGVWTYQESNGIFVGGNVDADLQRGGSSQIVPDDNESCVDDPDIAPDTLIE